MYIYLPSAARTAPKHVVVVTLMVAVLEALGTYGHAGREGTGATSIGHIADVPHEATYRAGVECFHYR